jgi:biopolymer transport protein ExbD
MKKQIISTIGCVAMACAVAGCAHTTKSMARNDGQQPVAISIAHDGTLSVGGEQCPPDQLSARLSELAAQKNGAVKIEADQDASYKQLVAVTDACKAAGVRQVFVRTIR